MDLSLIKKIQESKDAIKNAEHLLEDDLQKIQLLQNDLIMQQKQIIELNSLISDSVIQEEILKKKNLITQTNIDHIQNNYEVIDELKLSFQNSENANREAKEKHKKLQNEIKNLESNATEMQKQMNFVMLEFEQKINDKQNLSSQYDQLKGYRETHFELSNEYALLKKQEEFLLEQLNDFSSIYIEQEKKIISLMEENEKYSIFISKIKKESKFLQRNIEDVENQLSVFANTNELSQVSEDYLSQIKAQIALTESQISNLKATQNSIEKSLLKQSINYDKTKPINIDKFAKKAEKMQKELMDDKKALLRLEMEKAELMNEVINKKFYTATNQQKLVNLQNLQSRVQKMKSRDSIYHKEISELRSKSEKLEIDLKSSEESILKKKAEQEELSRRIQTNQEIKDQHEKAMGQIQSKFNAIEIKSNQEEIDKLHKENKELMKKILKSEDLLGQKRIKKKKEIKKKPFFL